jgi:hypothetical protein
LKRIRRNEEEEVLRGEPEDDREGTAGTRGIFIFSSLFVISLSSS